MRKHRTDELELWYADSQQKMQMFLCPRKNCKTSGLQTLCETPCLEWRRHYSAQNHCRSCVTKHFAGVPTLWQDVKDPTLSSVTNTAQIAGTNSCQSISVKSRKLGICCCTEGNKQKQQTVLPRTVLYNKKNRSGGWQKMRPLNMRFPREW